MNSTQEQINNLDKAHHKRIIHRTSIHSYSFYFICLLLGMLLDTIFRVDFFEYPILQPAGVALLIVATVIILWAQISFIKLDSTEVKKEHFCRGPYCYVRNPTHWGLFFLIIGFGFIFHGFFVILLTVLSHLVAKIFFIKRYEHALLHYFGAPYEEYKKSVKI